MARGRGRGRGRKRGRPSRGRGKGSISEEHLQTQELELQDTEEITFELTKVKREFVSSDDDATPTPAWRPSHSASLQGSDVRNDGDPKAKKRRIDPLDQLESFLDTASSAPNSPAPTGVGKQNETARTSMSGDNAVRRRGLGRGGRPKKTAESSDETDVDDESRSHSKPRRLSKSQTHALVPVEGRRKSSRLQELTAKTQSQPEPQSKPQSKSTKSTIGHRMSATLSPPRVRLELLPAPASTAATPPVPTFGSPPPVHVEDDGSIGIDDDDDGMDKAISMSKTSMVTLRKIKPEFKDLDEEEYMRKQKTKAPVVTLSQVKRELSPDENSPGDLRRTRSASQSGRDDTVALSETVLVQRPMGRRSTAVQQLNVTKSVTKSQQPLPGNEGQSTSTQGFRMSLRDKQKVQAPPPRAQMVRYSLPVTENLVNLDPAARDSQIAELNQSLECERKYSRSVREHIISLSNARDKLSEDVIRLRKEMSNLTHIAEAERKRAEDAWRRLEQIQVYNSAAAYGAEQRFFMKNKYEAMAKKMKEGYDVRFKALENDRVKLARENEVMSRKIANHGKKTKRLRKTKEKMKVIVAGLLKTIEMSYPGVILNELVNTVQLDFDPSLKELLQECLKVEENVQDFGTAFIDAVGGVGVAKPMEVEVPQKEDENDTQKVGPGNGGLNLSESEDDADDEEDDEFVEVYDSQMELVFPQSSLSPDVLDHEQMLRKEMEDEVREVLRKQEEEHELRKQEEEQALRKQEEEQMLRKKEEEQALRKKEEEQALRKQEEEQALRKQEEEQALRKKEEEQALRKQEEELELRKQEEEERLRKQEEEERLRKQEEELMLRKKEEEQAVRKQEEEERLRKQEEEKMLRKKEEEERLRKQEEEQMLRKQEEEQMLRKQEEEERLRKQEEEEERKKQLSLNDLFGNEKPAGEEKVTESISSTESESDFSTAMSCCENNEKIKCSTATKTATCRDKFDDAQKEELGTEGLDMSENKDDDDKRDDNEFVDVSSSQVDLVFPQKGLPSKIQGLKRRPRKQGKKTAKKTRYSMDFLFGLEKEEAARGKKLKKVTETLSSAESELSSSAVSCYKINDKIKIPAAPRTRTTATFKDRLQIVFDDLDISSSDDEKETTISTSAAEKEDDIETDLSYISDAPASPDPDSSQNSILQWCQEPDEKLFSYLKKLMNHTVDEMRANPSYIDQVPPASPNELVPCFYKMVINTDEEELDAPTVTDDKITRCPLCPQFMKLFYIMTELKKRRSTLNLLFKEFLVYLQQLLENDTKRELERENGQILESFGRFVGAISLEESLQTDAMRTIFAFGLFRGPFIFPYACGVLCSDSSVFGYHLRPFNEFDVEGRALIMTLVKNPRWGNSFWSAKVNSLVTKGLQISPPDLTYEEYFNQLVAEYKQLESQKEIESYTKVLSLFIVQKGWKWFNDVIVKEFSKWMELWKEGEMKDGIFSGYLEGVLGQACCCMRRIDLPDEDDVQIVAKVLELVLNATKDITPVVAYAATAAIEKINKIELRPKGGRSELWHYLKRRDAALSSSNDKKSGRKNYNRNCRNRHHNNDNASGIPSSSESARGRRRGRGGTWVRGDQARNSSASTEGNWQGGRNSGGGRGGGFGGRSGERGGGCTSGRGVDYGKRRGGRRGGWTK